MVDETHNLELAIEHDIERILHPTGATGPDAAVAPVPGSTLTAGPFPAAAPTGPSFPFAMHAAMPPPDFAPTGVTGMTGLSNPSGVPLTPQGVTGPFHVMAAYEATGSSGPYFVLAKDPNAPPSRFGVDSFGNERVPPPEPASDPGTGHQTGSQHQIFDKR